MTPTTSSENGTVALVVSEANGKFELLEALSDDQEISLLEQAVRDHENDPLELVHKYRDSQAREEEEFGDYVEELLSQPFVKPEIQEHGLQWMKSKMKIEEYRKKEEEATKVIAAYAIKVFQDNPEKREFWLSGTHAQVFVKVVELPQAEEDSGQQAA